MAETKKRIEVTIGGRTYNLAGMENTDYGNGS